MTGWHELAFTGFIGFLLILICCLNLYESLRFLWRLLPKLNWLPHLRVAVVVIGSFAPHIINIWFFGTVYFLLHSYNLGNLTSSASTAQVYTADFFNCLYFSAVSYTTLGLGDVTPEGALRMITGVESLTGFILIGWTVSFTYFAMQAFWELPHRRHKKNT